MKRISSRCIGLRKDAQKNCDFYERDSKERVSLKDRSNVSKIEARARKEYLKKIKTENQNSNEEDYMIREEYYNKLAEKNLHNVIEERSL